MFLSDTAMSFNRTYNLVVVIALIVAYLTMPASGLARAATLDSGPPSEQMLSSSAASAPCDNCPCSDGHGSDCCDSIFCSCSCHAPLIHGLQLSYSPEISTQCFQEPSWSLLQVYRSIFVPPQNFV
jgi:hypothetical protein